MSLTFTRHSRETRLRHGTAEVSSNVNKFKVTMRVMLDEPIRLEDPTSDSGGLMEGYYRSVLLYARSTGDAIPVLRNMVSDGQIDWSSTEIEEVKGSALDLIRMLLRQRVAFCSGKIFFPLGDGE